MLKRIHLIGICGTAMATLAALLKSKGYDVRGSDQNVYPPMSDFLQQQGITILQGYSPSHVSAELDLVVIGNAISRGNPELEEVLDRKIRYCSLPEAVRDHFLWGARSIVIAGTHGKTTTTSLAGWLLAHGGADPNVFIGGIAENFESSYRIGGGRDFVIEGDEYDSAFFDKTAKFLKYLPDIAVVNNIEFDHVDIYPDLDAIRLAFRRFVNLVPRRGLLLLGADNADALALREARALPRRDLRPVRRRRLAGTRPEGGGHLHRLQRPQGRHARRARSRCHSSAPTTSAMRWPRSRWARRSAWPPIPSQTELRRFRGRPAPHAAPRDGGAASPCTTTSRIIRPQSARRSKACVPPIRIGVSGRSSNRARRRPAGRSSRRTSRGRWRRPTASSCRPCSGRRCRTPSACPPSGDRRSQAGGSRCALHPEPTTSSQVAREAARAISWSSCRTAASTTSIGSCWPRSSAWQRAGKQWTTCKSSRLETRRCWWRCRRASIPRRALASWLLPTRSAPGVARRCATW